MMKDDIGTSIQGTVFVPKKEWSGDNINTLQHGRNLNSTLSQRSQTQKTTVSDCIIVGLHLYVQNRQIYRDRNLETD